MNVDELWNEILKNEGNTFFTKLKYPFEYEVQDSSKIRIFRNGSPMGYVTKDNIRFILENPNEQRHFYRDNIKERTTSYSLALVTALKK